MDKMEKKCFIAQVSSMVLHHHMVQRFNACNTTLMMLQTLSSDDDHETAIVIREVGDKVMEALERDNEWIREFTRVIELYFSSDARLFEDMRNVASELQTMGLPTSDVLKAQRLILRSPAEVHMFWVNSSDTRKDYVLYLLGSEPSD
ncbi:hypothetical protein ACFE04_005234 [Oxalis oulophora]